MGLSKIGTHQPSKLTWGDGGGGGVISGDKEKTPKIVKTTQFRRWIQHPWFERKLLGLLETN
jgi:hypothetical protein